MSQREPERDWFVVLALSWNRGNGAPGQGGRAWIQSFPLSATEADVYQWAMDTIREAAGLGENQPMTVLYYRAVPNVPPGHVPA